MTDVTIVRMNVDALVLDSRAQPRAEIEAALVQEYREDMERGDSFPPVIAWGTTERAYLSSGWHRYQAVQQAGRHEIEVDLRQGGLDEAIWHSLSTNYTHGKRRTNADKHRAVERALRMRPELSDREIALHCAVGRTTVLNIRRELSCQNDKIEKRNVRRNGRDYVMDTGGIGRARSSIPTAVSSAVPTQRTEVEHGTVTSFDAPSIAPRAPEPAPAIPGASWGLQRSRRGSNGLAERVRQTASRYPTKAEIKALVEEIQTGHLDLSTDVLDFLIRHLSDAGGGRENLQRTLKGVLQDMGKDTP